MRDDDITREPMRYTRCKRREFLGFRIVYLTRSKRLGRERRHLRHREARYGKR